MKIFAQVCVSSSLLSIPIIGMVSHPTLANIVVGLVCIPCCILTLGNAGCYSEIIAAWRRMHR